MVRTEKHRIIGHPEEAYISTTYAERQYFTMRMSMRRFTRRTNAFSKKLENLECAVTLHYLRYNFARPHQSLQGKTPAMAAGVEDHQWSVEQIGGLLES